MEERIDSLITELKLANEDEFLAIESLAKLRTEKVTLETEMEELLLSSSKIQTDIMSDVANALDENNKPKFSNAEKRDAEKQRLLNENDEYNKINSRIIELKYSLRQNQNDFDFKNHTLGLFKNVQANIRAVLYVLAGDK